MRAEDEFNTHVVTGIKQEFTKDANVCRLHKISDFIISEAYGSFDEKSRNGGPCVMAVNTAIRIARIHLMIGRNCATKPCLCKTRYTHAQENNAVNSVFSVRCQSVTITHPFACCQ